MNDIYGRNRLGTNTAVSIDDAGLTDTPGGSRRPLSVESATTPGAGVCSFKEAKKEGRGGAEQKEGHQHRSATVGIYCLWRRRYPGGGGGGGGIEEGKVGGVASGVDEATPIGGAVY